MTTYELAQKYYPRLWNDKRLNALVAAGRLTKTQVSKIKQEAKSNG